MSKHGPDTKHRKEGSKPTQHGGSNHADGHGCEDGSCREEPGRSADIITDHCRSWIGVTGHAWARVAGTNTLVASSQRAAACALVTTINRRRNASVAAS